MRFLSAPEGSLRLSGCQLSKLSPLPTRALVSIEGMQHLEVTGCNVTALGDATSEGTGALAIVASASTRSIVVRRLKCSRIRMALLPTNTTSAEPAACLSVWAPSAAPKTTVAIIDSDFSDSTRPLAIAGYVSAAILARSSFTNNSCSHPAASAGGALAIRLPDQLTGAQQPLLRMECATFKENICDSHGSDAGGGGAIAILSSNASVPFNGLLQLLGCTFEGNAAPGGLGGAVLIAGDAALQARIEARACGATGNKAWQGGWLASTGRFAGSLEVTGSLFHRNQAKSIAPQVATTAKGGVVYLSIMQSGASVLFGPANVIKGNTAGGHGGVLSLLCLGSSASGRTASSNATRICFVDCQLEGNRAGRGGVVKLDQSNDAKNVSVDLGLHNLSVARVGAEHGGLVDVTSISTENIITFSGRIDASSITCNECSASEGGFVSLDVLSGSVTLSNITVNEAGVLFPLDSCKGSVLYVYSLRGTVTVSDSTFTLTPFGIMCSVFHVFSFVESPPGQVLVVRSRFLGNRRKEISLSLLLPDYGAVLQATYLGGNVTFLACYFFGLHATVSGGVLAVTGDVGDVGSVTFDSCTVDESTAGSQGGLVWTKTCAFSVALLNTTVMGCSAAQGSVLALGTFLPWTRLEIVDSRLVNNTAHGHGGVVHFLGPGILGVNMGCSILVLRSVLRGNAANAGGILAGDLGSCRMTFDASVVEHNSAETDGGVLAITGGTGAVVSCVGGTVLAANSATMGNGGVLAVPVSPDPDLQSFSILLDGCIVTGNRAAGSGGALYLGQRYGGTALLSNSAFAANRALLASDSRGLPGGVLQADLLSQTGKLLVTNTSMIDNSAAYGAALSIGDLQGTLQVTRGSLLRNNTAMVGNGGALFVGMLRGSANITLDGVRFHGNAAQGSGGAGQRLLDRHHGLHDGTKCFCMRMRTRRA